LDEIYLDDIMQWRKFATIVLVLILTIAGTVYALYWIYSAPVTVVVEEYTLSLTPSSQTVVKYHYANFTAQLLLNGNPVQGATIHLLFANKTPTGVTGLTNTTGYAILQWNATGNATLIAGYEVP